MTSNKDTLSDKNTSSTYISDARYRSAYNPSLNPVNIHYIDALHGYKHGPLERSFNYLDMGCGDGTTLNILAGLFPEAHFTGIDFNKEHIRVAKDNASADGLSNVVFHELDFLNMDVNAFPDFDFIVCYGTFSWIGGALQDAVCNFTGDKLKQNGLFLIHFAARPGKVQIDPLWHLMRSVPADKFNNSTDRARYGINLICSLKNRGSQFFRQNPLALARANSLENQDLHYVAHEALTEWQALNHSDVVTRMSGVGLSFAGSINPEDNRLETCVPETFRGLVEEAENIGIKETVIDYVLNRGIRTDIYIKSTLPNDRNSPTIEDIPLGFLNKDNSVQREFKFSNGLTVSYDNQIYADISLELANGAMTINNLHKTNRMVRYHTEDIQHAIQMLVAGKQIKPFKKSFSITRTTAAPGHLKPATPQIDHILRSGIDMNEMIFLPNKLSGQCMELEPQVALILSALVYERKEGALPWILNQLESAGAIKVGTGQAVSAAQINSMVLERIEWVKKVVLSTMVGYGFFIEEG